MTFGAPHWLWLLLLGLPIVLLYTRRPRRPVVRVPAVWLWTQVVAQARAPSGRVLGRLDERLLALLLFLLALLGAVLGLSRPGAERPPARAVVVVVDVGAAAGVRDGVPARTRLERAREALARIEGGLGPDDRRWVIAAGAAPRVVAGPEDALPEGAPRWEGGRSDLVGALALARAVQEGLGAPAQPLTYLLTATALPGSLDPLLELSGVQVVDVRASPGPAVDLALDGTLARVDATHVRLTATVENRGRSSTAARLEVLLDGAPLVREPPQPIAPGDRLRFAPRDLACPEGGVLEVRLAQGEASPLAWVVPPPRRLRVALDDPTHDPFLRAALDVDPGVELVAPDARPLDVLLTTAGGPAPRDVGAVVRVGPDALAGAVGLAARGDLTPSSPRLVAGSGRGDLDLGGLDLEDRLVARAAHVEVGPGWRALARAGEAPDAPPLVLVRDDAEGREVALTFEPRRTDLVLGRAFPLLIARALRWAARHVEAAPRWTRAGEVATFASTLDGRREARGPDAASVPLAALPAGGAALRLDHGPGAYAVGEHVVVARATPRPREQPASPDRREPTTIAATVTPGDRAGACVLLALLALLAEATIFHRRGLP